MCECAAVGVCEAKGVCVYDFLHSAELDFAAAAAHKATKQLPMLLLLIDYLEDVSERGILLSRCFL